MLAGDSAVTTAEGIGAARAAVARGEARIEVQIRSRRTEWRWREAVCSRRRLTHRPAAALPASTHSSLYLCGQHCCSLGPRRSPLPDAPRAPVDYGEKIHSWRSLFTVGEKLDTRLERPPCAQTASFPPHVPPPHVTVTSSGLFVCFFTVRSYKQLRLSSCIGTAVSSVVNGHNLVVALRRVLNNAQRAQPLSAFGFLVLLRF